MLKKSSLTKVVASALCMSVIAIEALGGGTSFADYKTKDNSVNLAAAQTASSESANEAKYVFYMIGDGLGSSQRQIAEYYKQQVEGDDSIKLTMNSFPIAGLNTTHSLDTLVTDSAAAGTALATGHKTNNGMISQLPNGQDVETLLEKAEKKGLATGLITTTRLTHATPAVFASHNVSRGNEDEIAVDYLDSGAEFLAGGGYRHFVPQNWIGGKSKRTDDRNVLNEFREQGYEVFYNESTVDDFRNYEPTDEEKVIATFTYSHLPYEIDRAKDNTTPSIAEITEKGIEVLSKYEDGFFLMVEGGRIDHASHANDAPGTIHDTLAFDEAVKEAYDFYLEHPDETLIVVVGDHETGGLGMGFGNNYFINLDQLEDVNVSIEDTLQGKYTGNREEYFNYIAKELGLDDLNEQEKVSIEKAMNIVDQDITDIRNYGSYDPVAISTTHVISERANIFWTTFAHSGTAIPMSAIGVGSDEFGGYKDNTEIGQTLGKVLAK